VLVTSACAHFPVNRPLRPNDSRGGGYRFENLQCSIANTSSLLVCLSFSGGGTRAAAFSLGVLEALEATKIQGGTKRLIDEVDAISAVSGGSFTAAYFGLYGKEKLLRDFEPILERDFTAEILRRGLLCPWNGIRLMSPWFERSDLAAELYDETIYGGKTYADLQGRGRPFVVLGATNLSLGERFEFTQDDFDLLGSALRDVPVGRAVAASSAFPFLLTPVTVVNHGARPDVALPAAGEPSPYRTLRARERARNALAADREHHPFVHLVDGGVADNLGLGYLLDSYRDGFIRRLLDAHEVSTLVFIVVNARNRVREDMDVSPRAPGVTDVVVSSMTASIDRHASALSRMLEELRDSQDPVSGVKVHAIEVNLEDLPDDARRERLLGIGTNYALSPSDIRDVRGAGAELVLNSPEFRELVAALR
jgi:NTE family protein